MCAGLSLSVANSFRPRKPRNLLHEHGALGLVGSFWQGTTTKIPTLPGIRQWEGRVQGRIFPVFQDNSLRNEFQYSARPTSWRRAVVELLSSYWRFWRRGSFFWRWQRPDKGEDEGPDRQSPPNSWNKTPTVQPWHSNPAPKRPKHQSSDVTMSGHDKVHPVIVYFFHYQIKCPHGFFWK